MKQIKKNITIRNNMIDFLFNSIALPLSIEIETKLKKLSTHLFIIIKGRYKYITQSYGYGNCWLKSLMEGYNCGDTQPQ